MRNTETTSLNKREKNTESRGFSSIFGFDDHLTFGRAISISSDDHQSSLIEDILDSFLD